MSLELCVLASGSSGNCAILRAPTGVMLIDAGIGPRVASRRMDGTGVALSEVRAICLTHLDSDHCGRGWSATILARGIRVFCHDSRRGEAARIVYGDADAPEAPDVRNTVHGFDGRAFTPIDGVRVTPIPLAHDRTGSHGFVFEGFGTRIGYATDLGFVPRRLSEQFVGLDVLAIESNYDPRMELASARPAFVKERIMGGRGHLSNQEAFDAVRSVLDRSAVARRRLPEHIVLLHRSRECNCPKLMRELFAQDPRIAPRLVVAEQYRRTEWLRPSRVRPHAGEQLTLAFRAPAESATSGP